jgi:PelA/Pel-15E family pectate lyase
MPDEEVFIMKFIARCVVTFGSLALLAGVAVRPVGAEPLKEERVQSLPEAERGAWQAYLDRSIATRAREKELMGYELEIVGSERMVGGITGRGFGRFGNRDDAWLAGAEARTIAENILTYQTPAGGWGKNIDMGSAPRAIGQSYAEGESWHYVGTLDNNATTFQMQFLGRVAAHQELPAAREGFLKGLEYLFVAQYPNGGWPQNYPLEFGYHDNITFNDGAMTRAMNLLRDVGAGEYAFVPEEKRAQARGAVERGLECILAAQVKQDGKLTVWCAQHDPLTLEASGARAFEPASLSGGESAGIVEYLMSIEKPDARVVASVESAAAWFKETAIYGQRYNGRDLTLVPEEGAGPIWARFYELGTGRTLFTARTTERFYEVSQLPPESNGYAWYVTNGRGMLESYPRWRERVGGGGSAMGGAVDGLLAGN